MKRRDPEQFSRTSWWRLIPLITLMAFGGSLFAQTYCGIYLGESGEDYIDNVTFAGINNTSGDNGTGGPVVDYTSIKANVHAGSSYTLSVTIVAPWGGDEAYAFFDWNQNGTLDDAGEVVQLGTDLSSEMRTVTVTVPVTATLGTTRMRVMMGFPIWDTWPNPCVDDDYGEAEDYSVEVTAAEGCTSTPFPGNTTGPATACAGVPFTLNVENPSTDTGISYQWEYSANGSDWYDAPGASTNATYSATQTSATWYRVQVTCDGNGTGTSTPLQVGMTLFTQCYCNGVLPSAGSNDATGVTRVIFNTIDNSSASTAAYTDYKGISTTVEAGASYNLSVNVNTAGSYDVATKAWIDWDRSGTFDAGEEYDLGTAYNVTNGTTSLSPVSIPVPLTAEPGNTVMRVRAVYNFQGDPAPVPCGSQNYSEAEDYTVNVLSTEDCAGTPAPGNTSISGTANFCSGTSYTLSTDQVPEMGITHQWQSSPDNGTWTDIPGATSPTLSVAPSEATWYRDLVTCSADPGNPVASTAVQATAATNAPAYALYDGVSYTESFESWVNGCGTTDRPSANWNATPTTGNNSWRRNDQGASASWSYLTDPNWHPPVAPFPNGDYCALFHTYGTPSGSGTLDLYLDMSAATGISNLKFWYINPSGTDNVMVYQSTDGGATFTQLGSTLTTSTTWSEKAFTMTSTSATTVLRLTATSDFGADDIGIDHLRISAPLACEAPSILETVNLSATSTSVIWDCPSCTGQFYVEYGPVGFTPGLEDIADGGTVAGPFSGVSSATLAGLTTGTTYQVYVRQDCGDEFSPNSSPLTFLMDYCTAGAVSDEAGIITNVSIANINNSSSGTTGYEDFTSITGTLALGTPYSFSASATGTSATQEILVWVDLNQDYTFTPDEIVFQTISSSPFSGTITLPETAMEGPTRMRVRVSESTFGGSSDPCGNSFSGQVEDYTLNLTIPVACDGPPSPGATTGPASVCDGVNFTLGMQNVSLDNGITYEWEVSTDGTNWGSATGINDEATYTTSQAGATWYRVQVTCDGNGTVSSTPLLVEMGGIAMCGSYCTPAITTVEPICNVTFADINNSSSGTVNGTPAVQDFTSITAHVIAGNTYTMSLTGNSDGNFTNYFTAFFDWDQDGTFETVEEIGSFTNSNCGAVVSGSVTIPLTASLGLTRMRVIKNFNTSPTEPCGSYSFGQAEDYLVEVSEPVPCAGTPDPGATTGPADVCAGTNFTLALANNPPVSGLSYQWYVSTDGTNFDAVPEADGAQFTTTQGEPSWYYCTVTCTEDGNASGNSDVLFVDMSLFTECYCTTPEYSYNSLFNMCDYYDYIGNFTFAGINNTTTCDNTPPYYNYYAGQTATVEQTGSYQVTISATPGDASFQMYKVYIDFNDNGSFDDAGEMVYTSGFISTATNFSQGTIVISADAPLGTHRLRVRSTNPLNTGEDANSCSDDGIMGEVEDYNIEILPAPPCAGTPDPGATLSSEALACSTTTINLSLEHAIPGTGVTYQWQASDDEAFTSPTDLGTDNTQTATLAATTWYRCLVTCDGNTAASTPVVVYGTAACYCTTPTVVSDGCGLNLYINNVTFAGIDNTSGCYTPVPYTYPYYSFFPEQEATVMQGGAYPFSASAPNGTIGYYHWYGVWIDFNDNGSFEDPGELVLASANGATVLANALTGTINIPLSAPVGQHIMRVRSGNQELGFNSCSANSVSGETEDYLVNIEAAPACAGTPAPGATTGPASICPDIPFTLGIENQPVEGGYTYQWYASTDGGSTYALIEGAEAPEVTITLAQSTMYYCDVTCTNSGVTVASTPWLVSMSNIVECYCEPTYEFDVEPICNVTFADINNTSDGTVDGSPAVEDFTHITAHVNAGGTYTISVTGNTAGSWTNHITAFFDWDRNGTLETMVAVGSFANTNCGTAATTSITVPETALGGITRMRIVKNFNTSPTDPCGSYGFGQAEDYKVGS